MYKECAGFPAAIAHLLPEHARFQNQQTQPIQQAVGSGSSLPVDHDRSGDTTQSEATDPGNDSE